VRKVIYTPPIDTGQRAFDRLELKVESPGRQDAKRRRLHDFRPTHVHVEHFSLVGKILLVLRRGVFDLE
jgi:hypothetical protein